MTLCFGLAFLALVATVVVAAVLPSAGDAGEMSGDVNAWTTTTRDFVLVIVLLTPLQAAGEEYAFRGYLTQAFGGLFAAGPQAGRASLVLPAILFALRARRPGRARSSSTGSPSAWSPASWSSRPAVSRPASPCTSSTTSSRTASRWPTAT